MTDTPDVFSLDIDHGSAAAVNAINNGKMNKFYELHNAYQNGQDISDSQFNGAADGGLLESCQDLFHCRPLLLDHHRR